jgi:hypothetical protein
VAGASGSVNALRANGVEPRSYRFLFAPNGVNPVVDIYDRDDIVASITRAGVGDYDIVMQPGVAPVGSTVFQTPGTPTAGYFWVGITPSLRTSSGTLGQRASQSANCSYDTLGRLNFKIRIIDAAGAPVEAGPNAGVVCEVVINVDEGRI